MNTPSADAVLAAPKWGFLESAMLSGLYVFAFSLPVSFVPAELAIAFSALCWMLYGILSGKWIVKGHNVLWVLAAYVLWNVVSSLASARPLHSFLALFDNEWASIVCILAFWIVPDEKNLRRLILVFLGVSTIVMMYAIWQAFSGVELWRGLQLSPIGSFYRSVGFNGFYLTFAGFAFSTLFLALNLGWETDAPRRERQFYAVSGILSSTALVFTFARSMWIALGVLLPIAGFLRGRRAGLAVTGILLGVLLVIGAVSESVRLRAVSILKPSENVTRLNLWDTSLNMAADFPVFGIGQDNFDYWFEKYRVEGFYDVTVHPHNDYLTVLVSSGVPGMLLWCSMWLILFRSAARSFRRSPSWVVRGAASGAGLGIAGFLIGGVFQNYYGTFANCLGWWFLAGIILISEKLAVSPSQNDHDGVSR